MLFLVIISQNIEIQDLGLPAAVQNLPTLVEQTHRSEPTSLSQSQHDHTVNQMIRNHSLDNIALIFWSTASVIEMCTFIKTMRLRIWCFLQSGPCCIQMQDRQSSVSRSSRSQQRMFNSCNKLKREDPQERLTLILQQESNLDSYDHLITWSFLTSSETLEWLLKMSQI
jgi:hypothetical protein